MYVSSSSSTYTSNPVNVYFLLLINFSAECFSVGGFYDVGVLCVEKCITLALAVLRSFTNFVGCRDEVDYLLLFRLAKCCFYLIFLVFLEVLFCAFNVFKVCAFVYTLTKLKFCCLSFT